MKFSKSNQKGILHLQGLIMLLIVVSVVGFAGYKVLQNSKAGTNPYSNGLVTDGYSVYPDILTNKPTYLSPVSTTAASTAYPVECKNGGNTDQYGARLSWNPSKRIFKCVVFDYSTNTGKISLLTMGYDGTTPQLIKTEDMNINGSWNAVGFHSIDSMAVIKDGTISKIAEVDAIGDGINAPNRIGIYDVATKQTNYLKDSSGKVIATPERLFSIEWTPDNTKLYFLKEDYRDNAWHFKVCSIPVTGGDMNCVTPTGKADINDQYGFGGPIWSYDLSSLYFASTHNDANNNSVGGIYKYSTAYSTISKLFDSTAGYYVLNSISPDDMYLLATTVPIGGTGSWNPKIYNTTNSSLADMAMSVWYLVWQPLRSGIVATTIPPDSGPVLTSNYSVSCNAGYGKLLKGLLPTTVTFTNNGPDATPANNVGSVILTTAAGTNVVANTIIPSLPKYGSSTWSPTVGPFARRTTYTVSTNYKNQAGTMLSTCTGTTSFTTK